MTLAIERPELPAPRVPGKSRQLQNASDYTDLVAKVKAAGLLERRPLWYAGRVAVLVSLYVAGFWAMFALGDSPWQLLLAVGFGVLFTQTAFLCHDGAHRQIFVSGKRNEWFSRVVGNLFVGLSYGWWMNKHSRHHANPNKIGKDNDITAGAIVFTPEDAALRTGVKGWFLARQHWYFFPILLLAGLDLQIRAMRAVMGREDLKHRVVEGILLAIRLIGFPVVVVLAAGPVMGAAFWLVQLAVFGLTMGGSFAPNHKGMPLVPPGMTIDFLRRQTLMSRNISGGLPIAIAMGGLNYQIEHHLFPNMPSVSLAKARAIVIEYCAELDVNYTETTLIGSYRIVLDYLRHVGLKYADPFECPVTQQFRTR